MKAKKTVRNILLVIIGIILIIFIAVFSVYSSRIKTMSGIEKITDYDDYNMYRMDVKYDYDIDKIISYGIADTQSYSNAVIKTALPLIPVKMKAPDFGCSAFILETEDGEVVMGRNYDFRYNSSAMVVHCEPKDGYSSVAFAALDNIGVQNADESIVSKLTSLTAPFVCLDGINEKGVSIAVLALDSEPTKQFTDKPDMSTTLAIRLVLDKAASTEEAVELLSQYDMFATSGKDYHFYIADSTGDGRVVEYDCESEERTLVAIPTRTVTNFYTLYADKVTEYGKNGIYGHGKDRYDKIESVFNETDVLTKDTAMEALMAASQDSSKDDITSNTQWSIVFDNTNLTLDCVLYRDWENVIKYDLKTNDFIE